MSKGKKEEKETEVEGAVCPACGEPDLEDGYCTNCRWIDSENTRAEDAADSVQVGAIDPDSRAYVVKRSWFTLYPVMIIACIFYPVIQFWDEIYNKVTGLWTIHPLMAAYLAIAFYITAVFLFNKTTVKVFRDRLEVVRGPLYVPFLKSWSLPAEKIVRIDFFRAGSSKRIEYEVQAVTEDDTYTVVTFEKSGEEKGRELCKIIRRTLQFGTAKKKERDAAKDAKDAKDALFGAYAAIALFLVIPSALANQGGITWRFDRVFWIVWILVLAAFFAGGYFYVRKVINIRTLSPVKKGESNPGASVYLATAMGISVLLLPAVMYVVNFFQ